MLLAWQIISADMGMILDSHLFKIGVQAQINSTYSSALTANHSQYHRYNGQSAHYFYEAIEVKVSSSDNITFISNSPTDMYGCIYNNTFDPSNSSLNLLQFNDDGGGNLQFLLKVAFEANSVYILVVTTYSPNVMTTFSVTAHGTNGVVEYNVTDIRPTSTTTTTETTTTDTTTTDTTTTDTTTTDTTTTDTTTTDTTTTDTTTTTTTDTATTTTNRTTLLPSTTTTANTSSGK